MEDDIINGYDLFWDDLYKLQPEDRLDRVIEMSKDEDGEQKMRALKEYFIDTFRNETREEWWHEDFVEVMCWMIENGYASQEELALTPEEKIELKNIYFQHCEIDGDRREEAELLGIDISDLENREEDEDEAQEEELEAPELSPKQKILDGLRRR